MKANQKEKTEGRGKKRGGGEEEEAREESKEGRTGFSLVFLDVESGAWVDVRECRLHRILIETQNRCSAL